MMAQARYLLIISGSALYTLSHVHVYEVPELALDWDTPYYIDLGRFAF